MRAEKVENVLKKDEHGFTNTHSSFDNSKGTFQIVATKPQVDASKPVPTLTIKNKDDKTQKKTITEFALENGSEKDFDAIIQATLAAQMSQENYVKLCDGGTPSKFDKSKVADYIKDHGVFTAGDSEFSRVILDSNNLKLKEFAAQNYAITPHPKHRKKLQSSIK